CVSRRAKSVNISFKTPTRGEIAHLVIDSTGLKVFGEGEWKVNSIDKGQWEAAASIGMTPWQTMRRAILPQAARVALPPLSNSFISLVKDTSLAATIQVPELFRQAQLITSRTLEVFTMYLAASLIYWIMATVLSTLQNHFENQLNRQEREPK
ncbi:ABC transporter permease subunit, partial [Escherichia coli]